MDKKSNQHLDGKNINFDIAKLRKACDEVLNIKGFDTSLGIPHFASISLNQIPGDPDSIKGNKARGVFWTKPNSSGKEVIRDEKNVIADFVCPTNETRNIFSPDFLVFMNTIKDLNSYHSKFFKTSKEHFAIQMLVYDYRVKYKQNFKYCVIYLQM